MLGIPQSGWYQNQGGYSDVWFPSQGGFTDASMMAAINAKLQPSPDVWIQQMMAQAGASQSLGYSESVKRLRCECVMCLNLLTNSSKVSNG
eukprot:symbB.v1.2.005835.t1/scaffold343.1/size224757/12